MWSPRRFPPDGRGISHTSGRICCALSRARPCGGWVFPLLANRILDSYACPTAYLRPPRLFHSKQSMIACYRTPILWSRISPQADPALEAGCDSGAFPVLISLYRVSVARELRLPFYAHMHDLWQEKLLSGTRRRTLADRWEREILTNSRRVLCMTETQRVYYQKNTEFRRRFWPNYFNPGFWLPHP